MCSAALCWRGLGLQARVFYFVLQSTALLRVSLGRCERLLREQRTVGIATGECLLRVLVVSKRFGRSRSATFHTSKPFNIIGERIVADC